MTGRGNGEPIEDYLDDLLSKLHLPARETRRLLAESEDHLQEVARRLHEQGVPRADAEREAVRRFGTATQVAAAAGAARRQPAWAMAVHAAWAGLVLAGVALLSVGVSGALAAVTDAVAGPGFVGALPQTYPAHTCAYYLAAHPATASCAQAAMLENSGDAVVLRGLAGAVGVVLLLAAWVWRSSSPGDPTVRALRDGGTAALTSAALGAVAVFLVGRSIDVAVQHGSGGVGFYLTGGIAAAAGGAVTAVWACHSLRHLRPWRFAQVPAPPHGW